MADEKKGDDKKADDKPKDQTVLDKVRGFSGGLRLIDILEEIAIVLLGGGALARFVGRLIGRSTRSTAEASVKVDGTSDDVKKRFATGVFGRGVNEETNYLGAWVELYKLANDRSVSLDKAQVDGLVKWLATQKSYVRRKLVLVVADRLVDYLVLHLGEERVQQLINATAPAAVKSGQAPAQQSGGVAVATHDIEETKKILEAATKYAVEILEMLAKAPDATKAELLEITGLKRQQKGDSGFSRAMASLRQRQEEKLKKRKRALGL